MTSILKVSTIQDPTNGNTALTVDTSGRILQPAKPAFSVSKTTNQNETTANAWVAINWDSVDVNVGNCYSANVFSAPVAGNYFLSYNIRVDNTEQSGTYNLAAIHFSNPSSELKLDRTYTIQSPKGQYQSLVYAGVINMDANQTAQVKFLTHTDTSWLIGAYGNYSGYLIG
jgi:hypothetical protein